MMTLHSSFALGTAPGILMKGRMEALCAQGKKCRLILQPFKDFDSSTDSNSNPPDSRILIYRNHFLGSKSLLKKSLGVFRFFLWDSLIIAIKLRASGQVVLHKTLPTSLGYAVFLRLTFFRGPIICIIDDWEGVGGFVTVRHASSLWRKVLMTFCEEALPPLCTHIQCVSQLLYKRMILNPSLKSKSFYLPNGSSIPPFFNRTKDSSVIRIIYVGTIKDPEVADFLVEIISTLLLLSSDRPCCLEIIGGGSCINYLKSKIPEDDTNHYFQVHIHGQIPHEKVLQFLERSHIALLPLFDTFPMSLIDASRSSTKLFEYLACGLAIVASKVGEPSFLLTSGNNAILSETNPKSFVEAILSLVNDPTLLSSVADAGQKLFEERFTQKKLMEEWLRTIGQ